MKIPFPDKYQRKIARATLGFCSLAALFFTLFYMYAIYFTGILVVVALTSVIWFAFAPLEKV